MLELSDNIIHKIELHERDAAENVLKINDLSSSCLCDSHLQAIKLTNRIICNAYFNIAEKHVNNQARREVVEHFKQRRTT